MSFLEGDRNVSPCMVVSDAAKERTSSQGTHCESLFPTLLQLSPCPPFFTSVRRKFPPHSGLLGHVVWAADLLEGLIPEILQQSYKLLLGSVV